MQKALGSIATKFPKTLCICSPGMAYGGIGMGLENPGPRSIHLLVTGFCSLGAPPRDKVL